MRGSSNKLRGAASTPQPTPSPCSRRPTKQSSCRCCAGSVAWPSWRATAATCCASCPPTRPGCEQRTLRRRRWPVENALHNAESNPKHEAHQIMRGLTLSGYRSRLARKVLAALRNAGSKAPTATLRRVPVAWQGEALPIVRPGAFLRASVAFSARYARAREARPDFARGTRAMATDRGEACRLVALNWIARIWLHGGYTQARKQKARSFDRAKCLIPWWRQAGSNRRPSDCEPDALPAELCPQGRTHSMRCD